MADGRTNPNKTPPNQRKVPPVTGGAQGAVTGGLGQWITSGAAGAEMLPPAAAILFGAYQANRGLNAVKAGKPGVAATAGGLGLGVGTAPFFAGAAKLFGKSKTETEDNRRDELAKQGINTFQFNPGMEEKYNAVVRPDLAPDFVGFDKDGNWVNNKFASTRDESSLTGRDIDKYAVFSELFGKDWANSTDENRWKVGDEAVKRGLLREHHGTLDVNADQGLLDFGKSLLAAPAAATGGKKSGTVLTPDKPKRKKQRPARDIPDSEFQPVGEPKPPRYAYTPPQPGIVTIQDYVDAITKNNSDNTVR